MYLTMVDGKVINALTKTSSHQSCYICGAKPTEMNKINNSKDLPPKKGNFLFGLSTLHAWIKFLEISLNIAYKLDLKRPTITGATDEERKVVKQRTSDINKGLKQKLGITVNKVVQGKGTSNTGNVARRFFAEPKVVAETTGVDADLLERFGVILSVLSSGKEVDAGKFGELAESTVKLYVQKHGWYRMSPSVHKILFHGAQVINALPLPIGCFSEEAQESCNKLYKRFLEHHTRKKSRKAITEDLIKRFLVWSDPVISSRRKPTETKSKLLTEKAISLLKE